MNPKDPDTLIQRGACLVELHRCEPAIVDMEKVFSLLELREGIMDCSHLKSRLNHLIDTFLSRIIKKSRGYIGYTLDQKMYHIFQSTGGQRKSTLSARKF